MFETKYGVKLIVISYSSAKVKLVTPQVIRPGVGVHTRATNSFLPDFFFCPVGTHMHAHTHTHTHTHTLSKSLYFHFPQHLREWRGSLESCIKLKVTDPNS